MIKITLIGLAVLFVCATLVPLVRYDQWWIRIFDFPRTQVALGALGVAVAFLFVWNPRHWLEVALFCALVLSVGYQAYKIFPYTRVASRQVNDAEARDEDASLKLLVANVLMTNRESDKLLEIVRQWEPDVLITVETDAWWEEQLRVLEGDYPYTVKCPIDNTYGMLMHSRLELIDPRVKFLLEEDVPSIHTDVVLRSGQRVAFHGLHPKPPYPKEDTETTDRDAELLIVGKMVKREDRPTIVAGDLNDVAWSHTTTLFQKTSGLLDPRIGRGRYNSFHADYFFLRWPLDHIFHSDHFKLISIERLPYFGSDHFPIFVHLQYDHEAETEQDELEADAEEKAEADEKIDKALQEDR